MAAIQLTRVIMYPVIPVETIFLGFIFGLKNLIFTERDDLIQNIPIWFIVSYVVFCWFRLPSIFLRIITFRNDANQKPAGERRFLHWGRIRALS